MVVCGREREENGRGGVEQAETKKEEVDQPGGGASLTDRHSATPSLVHNTCTQSTNGIMEDSLAALVQTWLNWDQVSLDM